MNGVLKSSILKVFNWNIIVEFISILYISLMLYTAISKLIDYDLSREQMAMMPLMTPIAHVISWLLPSTEIAIAILIFIPKTRMNGLCIVTGLMVFFTLYIVYMMTNYEHLPCSCGGLLQALTWKGHLIFNSIFILLGTVAIFLYRKGNQRNQQHVIATSSY